MHRRTFLAGISAVAALLVPQTAAAQVCNQVDDVLMISALDCPICARAKREFAQMGVRYRIREYRTIAQAVRDDPETDRAVPVFIISGNRVEGYNRQVLSYICD